MTGVAVTGVGSASAEPDVATLALSATCLRPTAGAAVAAADACVRRVADALSAGPAAAGPITTGPVTTGMSVHLEHDHTVSPPRQTGVRASHRLRVDVRDVDRLGDVLAAVLTAGGDDLGLDDVTVGVGDEAALDRRARDAAFADARARAEQLAGLAGRSLAEVLEVDEHGDDGAPRPLATRTMAVESLMVAPSAVVRTVRLTVRWALA